MKYNGSDIERIFNENLSLAAIGLETIPIARGRKPSFQGLNGWVYEQTIHSCLEDELLLQNISLPITQQKTLKGRAKVDLFVGLNTAIEIKAGGIFGDDSEKYKKYCSIAAEIGWTYLYITKRETHKPYYEATKAVFGDDSAFFLNEETGWEDFVNAVIKANPQECKTGSSVVESDPHHPRWGSKTAR